MFLRKPADYGQVATSSFCIQSVCNFHTCIAAPHMAHLEIQITICRCAAVKVFVACSKISTKDTAMDLWTGWDYITALFNDNKPQPIHHHSQEALTSAKVCSIHSFTTETASQPWFSSVLILCRDKWKLPWLGNNWLPRTFVCLLRSIWMGSFVFTVSCCFVFSRHDWQTALFVST